MCIRDRFKTDIKIDTNNDGIIWVNKVDNWKNFGVIELNNEGFITNFVEKPDHFVSDLAIIGVYYMKDGELLRKEMQYLIDNNIKEKGEYQLTNALESMKQKGYKFSPGKVDEWLDCGNKDATVYTNQRILELKKDSEKLVADSVKSVNSVIISPCYIGENVVIENSVVGPHVSIGKNSTVKNSLIRNSIIQNSVIITEKNISNSMIGSFASVEGKAEDLSLGDYSTQA